MGQKVSPKGLRIGVIKDWDARWYADKNYVELLHEDLKVRKFVKAKLFLYLLVTPRNCIILF